MKKSNVQVGKTYAVKVSGSVVPVKIERENPHGGWDGTNAKTGKTVRIASAQRLRGLWPKKTMPIVTPETDASRVAAREGLALSERSLALAAAGATATGEQTASEGATATSAPRAKRGRKAASEATGESGRDTGEPDATGGKQERPSLLNLAARVLAESSEPLTCQQMVERVLATGLWQTEGKTPAATLSSAILREVTTRGSASRFTKVERGKFRSAAQ